MSEKLGKGKPSKLTPELAADLCKYLTLGMSPAQSAQMCGVHRNTMRYWLRRGEKEWNQADSHYSRFLNDVNKATAACMRRGLMLVNQASATDWRPAAWLLERRFPTEFAPKQMVEVKAQQAVEEILEALARRLPNDMYLRVLAAVQEEMQERRLPEAKPVLAIQAGD